MFSIPEINIKDLIASAEAEEESEAVVVFCDHIIKPNAPDVVHWFTRDKYRHCFVMIPSYQNGTILINQAHNGIHAEAVSWDLASSALACFKASFIVRRVLNKKNSGYTPRGLITCVSVVKSVLGINDWRVITPYQLDRYLLKHRMIEEKK